MPYIKNVEHEKVVRRCQKGQLSRICWGIKERKKEKKRKKMLDNPEFDYHGILYPSLKKWCEKLKISKNSVVSKSRRSGCSLQEAWENNANTYEQ